MSSTTQLSIDPGTGYLERGRHRLTEAEVHARFVGHADFAASTTRQDIWDEYELGRDLLRSKVRIHAIWIGGSFLTSKVDANDMDALFMISASDYAGLDANGQQVVNSFLANPATGVRGHGFNTLDSYLVAWQPFSPLDPLGGPEQNQYTAMRGYWDDFWQRDRFNSVKGSPPNWQDALPVRGFLEVELDAYDR